MEGYVAGPVFLARPGETLAPGVLTVSYCLAAVAPDTWALEWVAMADADRAAAASDCGIAADQLPAVVEWVTARFERGFAFPHAFLDLAVAREFRRLFLAEDFRVLQISLPECFVASFLAMAAPPAQQPGYAAHGETAVYQALLKNVPGAPSGALRGFDVLGYDRYDGGFHSFRCHAFEQDFAKLGVAFNQWGLVDDEAQAFRCAEFAGSPEIGTCADGWHPWLIVEHTS